MTNPIHPNNSYFNHPSYHLSHPRASSGTATEATLDIANISVLKNNQNMAFPTGHCLPMGQPGDISQYSPSEAMGYSMRNAVDANDQAFFQQLLNGYLYLANQTTLYRQSQMGLSGNQIAIGLIGWSPNIMNILSSQPPYASLPNQFVSSASDADSDIICALIDASKKWGSLTATDPLSSGSNVINSISISDMISTAIQSFANNVIGSFTYSMNGKTYNPVMTNDNWGHDLLYPDYFDLTTFSKMIAFVGSNSSTGQLLTTAAQNTMQYVMDVANLNTGWIPDNPYSLSGPSSFGYEAVRVLMRMGEYIGNQQDPLNMMASAKQVLTTLVSNIFSGNYLVYQNGTVNFTPTGLTNGAFSGPLYAALQALSITNNLPPDVNQQNVATILGCLNNDLILQPDETDSMVDWQNNAYYSLELALLSQAISAGYQQTPYSAASHQRKGDKEPKLIANSGDATCSLIKLFWLNVKSCFKPWNG